MMLENDFVWGYRYQCQTTYKNVILNFLQLFTFQIFTKIFSFSNFNLLSVLTERQKKKVNDTFSSYSKNVPLPRKNWKEFHPRFVWPIKRNTYLRLLKNNTRSRIWISELFQSFNCPSCRYKKKTIELKHMLSKF